MAGNRRPQRSCCPSGGAVGNGWHWRAAGNRQPMGGNRRRTSTACPYTTFLPHLEATPQHHVHHARALDPPGPPSPRTATAGPYTTVPTHLDSTPQHHGVRAPRLQPRAPPSPRTSTPLPSTTFPTHEHSIPPDHLPHAPPLQTRAPPFPRTATPRPSTTASYWIRARGRRVCELVGDSGSVARGRIAVSSARPWRATVKQ